MGARLIHAAALVKVRANCLLTFAYFFCFYASRGVKERVSKNYFCAKYRRHYNKKCFEIFG
jgi:hypothetical protein